jgi:hypothetical protein
MVLMLRRSFLSLPALAAAEDRQSLQLFLLIGQSNMAGRGKVKNKDRQPLPRVFSLSKDLEWVPAVDPLHWDKPKIAGVGLARSFAQTLTARNPQAVIGLIPAAFGGTSLDQWAPGGELYTAAVARARAARKSGTLRGILWHQGEADSADDDTARSYADRWSRLALSLRSDLAPVPIVVGQLGSFLQAPFAETVNEQLAVLPVRVPLTAFVPSGGLAHRGDHLHFNAGALREFGRRYACAFLMLDPFTADGSAPKGFRPAPPPR